MRFIVLSIGILSVLLTVCGCSLSGHDVLEARLRQQESTIRSLEQQLESGHRKLTDQENELVALKDPDPDSPFHTAASTRALESSVAWGAVRRLRIQKLTAGVLPTTDGRLQVSVILQPTDDEGEVVKVAGKLTVRVQRPGETRLLAQSESGALDSRDLWSNGMIGRGFHIQLPFSADDSASLKTGDTLLVTAQLELDNDRRFETSSLITVRLAE